MLIVFLQTAMVWHSASQDLLSGFKQDPCLLISPGSRTFVRNLQKITAWPFEEVDEKSLGLLINRFTYNLQNEYSNPNLEIRWSLYATKRRPLLLSFIGARHNFIDELSRPVIVATVHDSTKMMGFFSLTFMLARDGSREAFINYIVAPAGNGLAKKIFLFIRRELSSAFALRYLYAEMEWTGREYWARPEFGFRLSPLQPSIFLDGQRISFEAMTLFNFLAFMRTHRLVETDLCIQQEDGRTIAFDSNMNFSPSNLRYVRRQDGERVAVEVLKSHENVQRRRLHFGHAFLVSNHYPRKGQMIKIRMAGVDYSDIAMLPWFGIADPCEFYLR